MSTREHRVVVVGASAAGLRCASRLARLQPTWRIAVVEQSEIFSYAACGLPYLLSGDIPGAESLRSTADGAIRDAAYFASVKGVEVLSPWRADSIDPEERTLRISGVDGSTRVLHYDDLVLATGARPRRLVGQPDHPRVRSFHQWQDVTPLHEGLAQGRIARVAVIGAGPIGCELAEAVRALWGAEVALIEAADVPLPGLLDREMGAIVASVMRREGVELYCNSPVEGILADDSGVEVIAGGRIITADVVVVAIGVEPQVGLASDAGITLGSSGAIAVDQRLATSVAGVWAAGDCIEVLHRVTGRHVHLPQGSLANRQGRVLANVLAGRKDSFGPVVGATAVKVFSCNVGTVGCTRRVARANDLLARSVWVTAHDRAHYWPESTELVIHLLYEQGSQRVLGVQVVGEGDSVKRADVAAQLLARDAGLDEFAAIEHAYAPPYAPALEPLAVAAFAAQNQEEGVVACSPLDSLAGEAILDVRHDEEREERPFAAGTVTSLPLELLRAGGAGLSRGPWLAVCERGTRSAEALRWLQEHGKFARYLGGGLRLRMLVEGEQGR